MTGKDAVFAAGILARPRQEGSLWKIFLQSGCEVETVRRRKRSNSRMILHGIALFAFSPVAPAAVLFFKVGVTFGVKLV